MKRLEISFKRIVIEDDNKETEIMVQGLYNLCREKVKDSLKDKDYEEAYKNSMEYQRERIVALKRGTEGLKLLEDPEFKKKIRYQSDMNLLELKVRERASLEFRNMVEKLMKMCEKEIKGAGIW